MHKLTTHLHPHPKAQRSPHHTQCKTRREPGCGRAGNATGKPIIPMRWEGCSEQRGQAEQLAAIRPVLLIIPESLRIAFISRAARLRARERLPVTKEAADTDLTPTEVYLVSARPTTISSLIPSELGSHYSPRDSVNNQYHYNEPGN